MVPIACGAEIHPETNPRCPTGTWSEITAVSAAVSTQNPMRARDQKMPMPTSDCWTPSKTSAAANTSAPPRIQGRRRPNLDVVRSERAPVSGKATSANTPAIPETMPKATTLSTQ
jgi:hypothetical protein